MRNIRFTKKGYQQFKNDYENLLKQRPSAVLDLKKARDMGDLSENGYYKAARAKLSSLDHQLRTIAYQLKQATIIEEISTQQVGIGTTVVLTDGQKEISYHIVGDLEANPAEHNISLYSPLGKALAGKKEGDSVTLHIPSGNLRYTITQISLSV